MNMFTHPETEKHKDRMQHYPYCTQCSNGNKLISREDLSLICLKPMMFSSCVVEYLTVLISTCIILKMSTCLYTAKIVEEAVCHLPFFVSSDSNVVLCVFLTLMLSELDLPLVTSKNWRMWCMPKLSMT